MNPPYVVPLELCNDPALYGGKAAGLARLMRLGFRVPPGVGISIRVFVDAMQAAQLQPNETWERARRSSADDRHDIFNDYRDRIAALTIPVAIIESLEQALKTIASTVAPGGHDDRWAVRSSATTEDSKTGSFAGLYRTSLNVRYSDLSVAIKECWASLWTLAALTYHERLNTPYDSPAMAVIVQRMLSPRAAGVAYSQHPVTHERTCVVISSVLGVGKPVVSGSINPDMYEVRINAGEAHVMQRDSAPTSFRHPTSGDLTSDKSVSKANGLSLTDEEATALARLVKTVEEALHYPVDTEWALEEQNFWLLQARQIAKPSIFIADDKAFDCAWSRANFKETLPDQPSPLGISFLRRFMETNILRHYLQLGCTIPDGWSAVRVIHGRPYINVTLFQYFVVQLGGNPDLVTEQMGGSASLPPTTPRLPWWKLLKAGILMEWKMRHAIRRAPRWFLEMKRLADDLSNKAIASMSPVDLLGGLNDFGRRLAMSDLTFAIVAGVSQGFSVLQRLLERRVGKEWRPLLNGCLQGLGTVISARQIVWLAELADIAKLNPLVDEFFHAEPWRPEEFRSILSGTHFLQAFDDYLAEYGHRALGESDLMSPRFYESPPYVLGVIREYVLSPIHRSAKKMRAEQAAVRNQARDRLRTAFGMRYHELQLTRLWLARIERFLTLRESNRHHLMYFTAAARRVLLVLGKHFADRERLNEPDDIFFLAPDEIQQLASKDEPGTWKALITSRRAERTSDAQHVAPDYIPRKTRDGANRFKPFSSQVLQGLTVSTGIASGPIRVLRTTLDFKKVGRGDIIVTPVLDPGMAPLFGLASGVIAEMGGILSHGAIIAREYGIPAVVNVQGATSLLREGESITLDATTGHVIHGTST